jgi:hypothetical protein
MLVEEVWSGIGDGGGCVKDVDWDFGKVDSGIVSGFFGAS